MAVTDELGIKVWSTEYTPFGKTTAITGQLEHGIKFTGKDLDEDTGLYYFNARWYDQETGRFVSEDQWNGDRNIPLTLNKYTYVLNNPLAYCDPTGNEPVKNAAGTVKDIVRAMDNSRTKIGLTTGKDAGAALIRLGQNTGYKGYYQPATTAPFNEVKGRYVYTEKMGWVDTVHFLYYAGVAYQAKQSGSKDPVGDAVRTGEFQESMDAGLAPYSAYSYEDLPSDKLGADFAVNYFDPNSKKTLSQQVADYLINLGATDPANAPNYEGLPDSHEEQHEMYNKELRQPVQNYTTEPKTPTTEETEEGYKPWKVDTTTNSTKEEKK